MLTTLGTLFALIYNFPVELARSTIVIVPIWKSIIAKTIEEYQLKKGCHFSRPQEIYHL